MTNVNVTTISLYNIFDRININFEIFPKEQTFKDDVSGIIGQIIYINNNNDIIFKISNNKKSTGNDLFLMDKRINLI